MASVSVSSNKPAPDSIESINFLRKNFSLPYIISEALEDSYTPRGPSAGHCFPKQIAAATSQKRFLAARPFSSPGGIVILFSFRVVSSQKRSVDEHPMSSIW